MSLFRDFDIYKMFSMHRNKYSLARLLEEFEPDYLTIEKDRKIFTELIKDHPDYAPVFFDDKQVLYTNRARHPDVAEKHELKLVNPFSLAKVREGVELDDHIAELKRILEIFPESERALHAITRLLFNAKRFQEAHPWAVKFLKYHPDNPNSHYLMGNVYENSHACDKAIGNYKAALAVSDAKFKRILNTQIGSCYYSLEDFASAYKYLWKGLNPYTQKAAQEDPYQLAFSAFVVGETQESILLLKMLLHGSPMEEQTVAMEAQALLQRLEQEGDTAPSFLEWIWEKARALFTGTA
jgi:tetratricopeptide (TPR) repeat protein